MRDENLGQFLLGCAVGDAADEELHAHRFLGLLTGCLEVLALGCQLFLGRLTAVDLLLAGGATGGDAGGRLEGELGLLAAHCAGDFVHLALAASAAIAAAAATAATVTTATTARETADESGDVLGHLVGLTAAVVRQRREVGALTI